MFIESQTKNLFSLLFLSVSFAVVNLLINNCICQNGLLAVQLVQWYTIPLINTNTHPYPPPPPHPNIDVRDFES